ncbi:Phosphoheptose isomerase [Paraburkholderia ultramafica]|uniref:Phosphoheptose isomerase n=1 Tax=Paraburkholderia ultramafica TaxID=1544867 RepID=A0A6S7B7N6_9BURK|nr:SIS domain-containing protein [Paraburkholderia ultramafica]CAB3780132.1 Phosphoheptose isomerase [Paraburkholderia ultramafica]
MPEDEPLQTLYPFLHGARQDADRLDAALLESVQLKARDSVDVKARFFDENAAALVRVAHALADVYRRDGRLFTMGNGGSSCDAAHIAVEFLHPVTTGRPALTALNLVADMAMLTAVGNDVGFNHVFVRQLVAQARHGDALIGVSTSGNSENLLSAFAKAKELGLLTIGLSGHDGGRMAASATVDHCLVVRSDSIHRVQETHVAIYHILWDLVHTLLADDRGGLSGADEQ